MKNKSIIYILSFLLIFGSGCSKFDEINTNPDVSTKGDPSMLLTGVEMTLKPDANKSTKYPFLINNPKTFMYPFLLQKEVIWTEGAISDYQYNKLTRTDYSVYDDLTNINKMTEAAAQSGYSAEVYRAAGVFLKSFKLFNLSMSLGDIPYSDALKGEEGNYKPKYDSQKEVMISILNQLDTAAVLFTKAISKNQSLSGDIFYSGDPSKWLKLVNSYKLYVLISLSAKESDTDLNIVNRFQNLVNNPDKYPMMSSIDDNFQITFRDKEGEKKPFYGTGFEVYAITSSFVIDKLKSLQDYRLFYYADPLAGSPESDFNSYAGLDPSSPNEVNLAQTAAGKASALNKLYYNHDYPQGFPYVIFGYPDVQFILSEAAVRGWISDPDTYYKNGIQASMEFRMTKIDSKWVHGMPLTDSYINSYLLKPEIQLPADKEGKLRQIMWQKYIGSLLQNSWNVFFDYRRTGYPEFPINPATNKNEISDKMPVRWMYPNSEYNYNQENTQAAVDSQFGGNDDENQVMWILK